MRIVLISFCILSLWCGSVCAEGLEGAIENAQQPAQEAEASLMTPGKAQEDDGAGLIEWADSTTGPDATEDMSGTSGE